MSIPVNSITIRSSGKDCLAYPQADSMTYVTGDLFFSWWFDDHFLSQGKLQYFMLSNKLHANEWMCRTRVYQHWGWKWVDWKHTKNDWTIIPNGFCWHMVNSTLEVLFWSLLGLLMLCTITAHWYRLLLILIILSILLGAVPGNKVGLVTTGTRDCWKVLDWCYWWQLILRTTFGIMTFLSAFVALAVELNDATWLTSLWT